MPKHLGELIAQLHIHRCREEVGRLKRAIQEAAQAAIEHPDRIPVSLPNYDRVLWSDDLTRCTSIYDDKPPPPDVIAAAKGFLAETAKFLARVAGGDIEGLVYCGMKSGSFTIEPVLEFDPRCFPLRRHFPLALSKVMNAHRRNLLTPSPWEFIVQQLTMRIATVVTEQDLIIYADALLVNNVPPSGPVTAEIARLDKDGFTNDLISMLRPRYPDTMDALGIPESQEHQRKSAPISTAAEESVPPLLNVQERTIVQALSHSRMTGPILAERAGYKFNSVFKQTLAALVRRGILINVNNAKGRGYEVAKPKSGPKSGPPGN